MKQIKLIIVLVVCFYGCNSPSKSEKMESKSTKVVIAHRGASGYLPEHTIASKAMAYAMNPDFLEQDLVLSKDNVPIVIHDIYLDDVTNVVVKFPDRKRNDGRYYVIDFTFEELKQLRVSERFDPKTGKQFYPDRFPKDRMNFKLHSLQEELELVQGMNKSTQNDIGIYPEIKEPSFHLKEGKDISKIVLDVLSNYNYKNRESNCVLQCFDKEELKRIRLELNSELFLVQLVEENIEEQQLEEFAVYADGIGPWYKQIDSIFVARAHQLGLKVHAYTFRADDLGEFRSFDTLLSYGFNTLNLDGVFTDFPDKAVSFLKK